MVYSSRQKAIRRRATLNQHYLILCSIFNTELEHCSTDFKLTLTQQHEQFTILVQEPKVNFSAFKLHFFFALNMTL